ncbi:MAG: glycine zipper 2TM domain-containing protein [Rubrivivax sp.]|nr:MAG: glycine zipper 2TM domain-containing protein [Rubrivivax sp.]
MLGSHNHNGAAMSTPSIKSTQVIAGVAVVLALLGGAYAIGRSSGPQVDNPPVAAALTESAAQADRDMPAARAPAPQPAPRRDPVQVAQGPVRSAEPVREPTAAERQEQRLAQLCNSCAVVTSVRTETREGEASALGTVGGAVIGGLLGNQVGGGTGKKIATVGGAVAGGYAGREIEKRQKSKTVWIIEARERDGRLRQFERSSDPGLRSGDELRLTDGGFVRN